MGSSLCIVLQDSAFGSELGKTPQEEHHLGWGKRKGGRAGG